MITLIICFLLPPRNLENFWHCQTHSIWLSRWWKCGWCDSTVILYEIHAVSHFKVISPNCLLWRLNDYVNYILRRTKWQRRWRKSCISHQLQLDLFVLAVPLCLLLGCSLFAAVFDSRYSQNGFIPTVFWPSYPFAWRNDVSKVFIAIFMLVCVSHWNKMRWQYVEGVACKEAKGMEKQINPIWRKWFEWALS